MKWVIYIMLSAQIGQGDFGGGPIKLDKNYDDINTCSFEASVIDRKWKAEYESTTYYRNKVIDEIKEKIVSKYGDDKYKKLEMYVRTFRNDAIDRYIYEEKIDNDEELKYLVNKFYDMWEWKPYNDNNIVKGALVFCAPQP